MKRLSVQSAQLVLLFVLFTTFAFSQNLDYRLGEVLFRLSDSEDLQTLTADLEKNNFRGRSIFDITELSKGFGVWRIRFDHSQIHQEFFLEVLQRHPLVNAAQFNHFLDNRAIPDDPYFDDQWHLLNTGQNGGTYGVDLDMPLAWDQTTGGLSYTGDTVVICIIDEFFDYQHHDLYQNVWINHNEIPDNNIDDDGNGYIDDYLGWNVTTDSDDISDTDINNQHGTGVSGIAGAVGNNGKGISGICWNIKMMLVSRGSTTADAIQAYTYPFINRKIYNETQGQSGAFIVATNASWGLDFAFPTDAPLWCAMYDSLGSVGILNSAATTNANANVEEVGDLPTTCTSPYLITTTSVNHNDEKVENAGYGAISIDLASFGTAVLSTFENNSYDYTSGTSVAAPQLTGAIGLLHTAPCPSFASFAKSNPAAAALNLKSYLIEGVDPNPSLEGITLSGGRLNVNNSLSLLLDDCDYSGCFTPFNVGINIVDTSTVNIDWSVEFATIEVNARYRINDSGQWIYLENVNSPLELTNLLPCTDYELQLQSVCTSAESAFTASFNIMTDGCCTAPSNISIIKDTELLLLNWDAVTSAIAYEVRYRPLGSSIWDTINLQQSYYQLTGLESCQMYELQLATICAGGQVNASDILHATTKGCGACIDLSYCNASGAASSERWISRIKIMDWEHYSTLNINQGYQDFTDHGTTLTQGGVYPIEIETDFDFFASAGIFHVWIDLNQDGTFSEEELLYQSLNPEYEVNDILVLPTSALLGTTRMRVAFTDQAIESCTNNTLLGEVEDYCMDIIEATECLPPINFSTSSTENTATVDWTGGLIINEYAFNYRQVGINEAWQVIQTFNNDIHLGDLNSCTDYVFFLSSICSGEASPASPFQYFRTKGCGICMDASYCEETLDNSSQFEWIEKVNIGGFEHHSGDNNGYLQVSDLPINLEVNHTYEVTITPGFPNDIFEEYFAIWLDINGDGSFQQENELLAQGYSSSGNSFSGYFEIPDTAIAGSTRLRISMKYGTDLEEACESGFEGETEDYCVNILPDGSAPCLDTYISSVIGLDSSTLYVEWATAEEANSYRFRYRPKEAIDTSWSTINTELTTAVFSTETCEIQEFQVQVHCPLGWSTYSEIVESSPCDNILVNVSEDVRISESTFLVYPNPFSGSVLLDMELVSEKPLQVQIFSTLGKLVKEYALADPHAGADQLWLGPLPPGIYFLQVSENSRIIYTTKLIAQAP